MVPTEGWVCGQRRVWSVVRCVVSRERCGQRRVWSVEERRVVSGGCVVSRELWSVRGEGCGQ